MKILLTNDDGYQSTALHQLAAALSREHSVFISAPYDERSCSGHALTIGGKLYKKRIDTVELTKESNFKFDVPCLAVSGTPADAVKFAVEHEFKDEKFDLVISGINTVLNVGTDAVYSGTFNSAQEGTLLGIKSIAVSTFNVDDDYSYVVDFVVNNLEKLVALADDMVTVNLNVPSQHGENINGIAVVPMGLRHYNDWYEENADGSFTMKGYPYDCTKNKYDNDSKMIDLGYITVAPVRVFMNVDDRIKADANTGWTL